MIRLEKKQKYVTHNHDKNQSIKIDPEIKQIIELADKNIKASIENIIHMLKKLYLCGKTRKRLVLKDSNQTFKDEKDYLT